MRSLSPHQQHKMMRTAIRASKSDVPQSRLDRGWTKGPKRQRGGRAIWTCRLVLSGLIPVICPAMFIPASCIHILCNDFPGKFCCQTFCECCSLFHLTIVMSSPIVCVNQAPYRSRGKQNWRPMATPQVSSTLASSSLHRRCLFVSSLTELPMSAQLHDEG